MKTLLTTCIVSALSLGSIANAQNLLINGDAEDGNLLGWSTDLGTPAAMIDCSFALYPSVDTGIYSFSMDQCDSMMGTDDGAAYSAQISQEVDTTGCNVMTDVGELTGGRYDFSSRYSVTDGDQATLSVTFEDIQGAQLESTTVSKSAADSAFYDASINGDIPAGASTAIVSLGGKGVAGDDTNPGAYHDNAAYEFTSCIAAYAVTAGKTACTGGNESNGGGDGNGKFEIISECDGNGGSVEFSLRSRTETGERVSMKFNGAFFIESQIGLMDGTGTGSPETFPYTGKISPNSYVLLMSKDPKVQASCLFTPYGDMGGTTVTITESGWRLDDLWQAHCEDANGLVLEGPWPIPTGGTNALGGKGRDKDRGSFWIGPMSFPLTRGNSSTYEN